MNFAEMSCSSSSKKLCGRIKCSTCYNRSFANHQKAQFWSSKNELNPIQVFKNSNKKYLFDCTDCGHEIEMILKNVSANQWCKFCNSDGICEEDCIYCYNKSFASHPMAIMWSNKNNYNPRNILKSSDKKCWFDCSDCGHSFESRLFSITTENHCAYCKNQKICNDGCCSYCYKKSCASHKMSEAWSPLNEISSRNTFLQSNKKIVFNCLICRHEYSTTPNHYYNRNGSCPYCANKKLCQENECVSCFNNSFASHPLVDCWSNKNNTTPRRVFKGSDTKYLFNCNMCNSEFESKLYNVLTGYWCPYCKNKTEGKVLKFIQTEYSDYKSQLRFDWCRYSKTNNIMPFDFGLTDKKILIELDGEQHFSQVSNWDSPESIQEKDIEKIKYALDNGFTLIHIYQSEVWNNTYDWKHTLKIIVQNLIIENNPRVIFVCGSSKYVQHITRLNNLVKYETINPKI